MPRLLAIAVITAASLAAQNAKSVIDEALKAIGNPKSIQYTGSGATFNVSQNVSPTAPWPRAQELKSLTRTVDYETQSSRNEGVAAQGPAPTVFVSGDKAWGRAPNGNITAQPQFVAERQMQIRVSPHGFLRLAAATNAKAKSRKIGGNKVTEISFAVGANRYVGTISADHLVEKVDTWIDNPVLGDMHVETAYSDYKDFGGVKLPTKIVQKSGGFPALELTITAAKPNVAVDIAVPDAVRQATPSPAVKVAAEKLADGVWYLTGGSHHSLVVEFGGHVAVVEAPQSEERSLAVIAEVKKAVPGKPIRYLVNTHHHFDHSGGLRTYVAEGATIVTHQINVPFYQKTLSAKRTINPDRLTRERRKPKIVGFPQKYTLADPTRTLELHLIKDNPHNEGILMAWLPKEKILAEVDVYSPAAPNATPPPPSPAALNLFENVQRLNLDVARVAALHGRAVTYAEFRKAIGK